MNVRDMIRWDELGGSPPTIVQEGGTACHDGYRSCFYRRMEADGNLNVIGRVFDPNKVYKKKGN